MLTNVCLRLFLGMTASCSGFFSFKFGVVRVVAVDSVGDAPILNISSTSLVSRSRF